MILHVFLELQSDLCLSFIKLVKICIFSLLQSSGGSEGTVTVKYSLKDQPVTNQLHFCLKPTEETQ